MKAVRNPVRDLIKAVHDLWPPPGVEGFPPFFPSTPFISPLLGRKVSLPFFLATLFLF